MVEEVEIERNIKGPQVSHDELTTRISDCNSALFGFNDLRVNWFRGSVGIKGYSESIVVPHLVEDPADDKFYTGEGVIYSSHNNYDEYLSGAESKRFYELTGISSHINEAIESVRDKGVVVKAKVVEKKISKGNNIRYDKESKNLHFLLGSNVEEEDFEWVVDNSENYGDFDEYKAFLREKGLTHIKLTGIDRTVWHADMRDSPGKWEYMDGKTTRYGMANVDLQIFLPFTDKHTLDVSVSQTDLFLQALSKTALFEKEEGGPGFVATFEGQREIVKTEGLKIDVNQYRTKAEGLEEVKIVEQTDNPFLATFKEDMERIPLLAYEDSVRVTRQINTKLFGEDKLVVRKELCEVRRDNAGKWQLLLPAGDYLPPEGDYRSPYLHSRIDETWGMDRGNLKKLIDTAKDRDGYHRGYAVQFLDGSITVAMDDDVNNVSGLGEDLEAYGIHEDMGDIFNKLTLQNQIEGRLGIDVDLLIDGLNWLERR